MRALRATIGWGCAATAGEIARGCCERESSFPVSSSKTGDAVRAFPTALGEPESMRLRKGTSSMSSFIRRMLTLLSRLRSGAIVLSNARYERQIDAINRRDKGEGPREGSGKGALLGCEPWRLGL